MMTDNTSPAPLEVHLYGLLRELVKASKPDEDTVMHVEFIKNEKFRDFIGRLGLSPSDIGDCFIDGNLAKPDAILTPGARIGLFPFNMVLLCGGQHLKGHGYTKKDVDVDYY